jgi:hypothetical protein
MAGEGEKRYFEKMGQSINYILTVNRLLEKPKKIRRA